MAEFGLAFDVARVILGHNFVGNREAQSRTLASHFGGELAFKDSREDVGWNAACCIGNGDDNGFSLERCLDGNLSDVV